MKLFKTLIIPLALILGYLVLVSYPYFFSKINRFDQLGILSLVEEKLEEIKKTGKTSEHLLKGEKIVGKVVASENNLGIVLIRFSQLSAIVTDRVAFRIKETGAEKWYFENSYNANQFQSESYFTFGFPAIGDSKNKTYIFEVVSLAGTGKNGIGLSPKKPKIAFVYKFAKEDLLSVNIFTFIQRKLTYTLNNVDIWQSWPLLISALFIYFMRKVKIVSAKKEKDQLESIGKKRRLAIGSLIFLIAFLYRFSASLVDQSDLFSFYSSLGNGIGVNSFYSLLGNGGDYDQFIRAATCAVKTFCPAILGQNFLIESSILGVFYEIFGFVGGLKAYLYLMIILSSTVAILPYIILSRKNFFTIGGIIGSLFLATSDYFTHMALNLPPDNGSLFAFSLVFIVYLLTIHIGTIRWLFFLGLAGAIDGLNKLLLLINDLAVLVLFVPVFFLEKAKKINKFPFFKLHLRLIFYATLPLLVFLVIYSAWEYVVQIKFSAPYYLRALIEGGSTYASSTIEGTASINESLSKGNILEKLFYYAGLSIVMLKRLIGNGGLNDLLLTPILLGLLFATFRNAKYFIAKFITIIIFAILAVTILALFRDNYLSIQEVGQYVYAWSDDIYVNVFLFLSIIFLFILNFKYQAFKFALPILPYVIMLIILTKNAPWLRLLAHPIAWSIVLLSFLIDWILSNAKANYALKRFWIGSILLVLFIFFYTIPKTSSMVARLRSGINNSRNEVKYLRWVNSELPKEAIVLAGEKSDLVTVAENVKSPIIYNSLYSAALLIMPNEIPGVKPTDFTILNQLKINEIPGLTPSDFSITSELKNKENFRKNKYIILEDDVYLWRARLTGVVDNVFSTSPNTLHANDYLIKVYKSNSLMNKGIYELKLKETGNL